MRALRKNGDDVGDQPWLGTRIPSGLRGAREGEDAGLAHLWVSLKDMLDLFGLYADPAALDLSVCTAKMMDKPLFVHPGKISCAKPDRLSRLLDKGGVGRVRAVRMMVGGEPGIPAGCACCASRAGRTAC